MNWPFWCVLGWMVAAWFFWQFRRSEKAAYTMIEQCEKLEAMVKRGWDREKNLRESGEKHFVKAPRGRN